MSRKRIITSIALSSEEYEILEKLLNDPDIKNILERIFGKGKRGISSLIRAIILCYRRGKACQPYLKEVLRLSFYAKMDDVKRFVEEHKSSDQLEREVEEARKRFINLLENLSKNNL